MSSLPVTRDASIPSGPETPYPSTNQRNLMHNTPHTSPADIGRQFTLSSAQYRDPTQPPPSSMNSAIASSPILPPSTQSGPGAAPDRPVFFRLLRRSRDGSVRLAGGSPSDVEANALPPGEYDQMLEAMTEGSTLPPAYQPHRAT